MADVITLTGNRPSRVVHLGHVGTLVSRILNVSPEVDSRNTSELLHSTDDITRCGHSWSFTVTSLFLFL